jgi:hypothetical protein
MIQNSDAKWTYQTPKQWAIAHKNGPKMQK